MVFVDEDGPHYEYRIVPVSKWTQEEGWVVLLVRAPGSYPFTSVSSFIYI